MTNGPYEAGLCDHRGHGGRGLTEGLDVLPGDRSESWQDTRSVGELSRRWEGSSERSDLTAGGLAVAAEGTRALNVVNLVY